MLDLRNGDCLAVLKDLEPNSVDSIVTDPPYGLSFMGRKWDYDVPSVNIWIECLRVLKPGGHLLAFAGTRTQHRMCVNIEDAGFEIRDMIAWVYGSGFPKSQNVGKAIDKAAGAEREVIGPGKYASRGRVNSLNTYGEAPASSSETITAPATPEAKQWDGWGTALKPALEPITVARKPFKGTVANNVLEHGTGAINIDGCRVQLAADEDVEKLNARSGGKRGFSSAYVGGANDGNLSAGCDLSKGRWPANLIHDGSDEVTELLNDAARFFYCAKANKKDREDGNTHPTVKPTDLMAYLCRLVTPPNGVILDPFMGSGSTGKAAMREGFSFIGIEREPDYYAIAQQRVSLKEDVQLGLIA